MVWPYDAKLKTFSALTAVPYATLNGIQDRIVDVHRDRSMFLPSFMPHLDAANLPAWQKPSDPWWLCRTAGYALEIYGGFPHGAVIHTVITKWYLATAPGMKINGYVDDNNFGSAGTAPDSTILGAELSPSLAGYPGWGVSSWTGLTQTIGANFSIRIVVTDPDLNDLIAGVQVTFAPLTASS